MTTRGQIMLIFASLTRLDRPLYVLPFNLHARISPPRFSMGWGKARHGDVTLERQPPPQRLCPLN